MGLFSRRHRLSHNRSLVIDLLHFASKVPTIPLQRPFDLGGLAEVRQNLPCRIAWPVLFLKAYGLLSADYPEFRQAYMSWPWPHLYQHPCSVGMLTISRTGQDGERLYWGRFIEPEARPLVELQRILDAYKTEPTETIFRRQLRMSRLPTPLRRLGWWIGLNVSGAKRAKYLGTFGLTTLASSGAVNHYHTSCLTSDLTYGPLDEKGRALVTILFDHRVTDGSCIARALIDLEAILQGPIVQELKGLYQTPKACA